MTSYEFQCSSYAFLCLRMHFNSFHMPLDARGKGFLCLRIPFNALRVYFDALGKGFLCLRMPSDAFGCSKKSQEAPEIPGKFQEASEAFSKLSDGRRNAQNPLEGLKALKIA